MIINKVDTGLKDQKYKEKIQSDSNFKTKIKYLILRRI